MVLLTNDEFLAQLSTLFEAKQGKGTVFVTQKRRAYFSGPGGFLIVARAPHHALSLSLLPCVPVQTPRGRAAPRASRAASSGPPTAPSAS